MASELFYIRVYRPAGMHEFEVEVDPDLIGLDDEGEVDSSPAREALRQAIRRARAGEDLQRNVQEEFVALVWDETDRLTTYALTEGSPFDKLAADRVAAAVDLMIHDGRLDARSPLGDARLDYGTPFSRAEAEAVLNFKRPEVKNEPGHGEVARGGAGPGGGGAGDPAPDAGGDGGGGPEARDAEPGEGGGGQRAATRDPRPRRVAPVQRRRRSRAGGGVVDGGGRR